MDKSDHVFVPLNISYASMSSIVSVYTVKLSTFSIFMLQKFEDFSRSDHVCFQQGSREHVCNKIPSGESVLYFNLVESCLLLRLFFITMTRKVQEFSIKMSLP